MTTAYTSLLGLALPVTGELSGTWGDTVNTAITSLLDTAVAGTTSITTDADITLTTTTGASNQARQAILLWNPASGTTTRYITAPAQSKLYTVINASGGTQSIVIRGVGPTTGVTIAKGESAMVAWNGSDFVKVSSSGGAITFTDLTVTGNTILGDAAADTLTVNATSTFAAPVNFQGLVKLPSTGRSAAAALTVTAPAFLYGVASTYTDTTSSGTIAAMAPFYSIAQPTLSTSNVTTYTNAATLYIANAPAAGGSATITNPYALYSAAGANYFGGATTFNSTTQFNGVATYSANVLFSADNTYDIGASGATRPRNLYLGGNLTVAGSSTLGDATTDLTTVTGVLNIVSGSSYPVNASVTGGGVSAYLYSDSGGSGLASNNPYTGGSLVYLTSTGINQYVGSTAMTTLTTTGLSIGLGTTGPLSRLDVALGTPNFDSVGNVFLRSTDALGSGIGAQLTMGGRYTSTAYYAFGGIAARKENSTSGNVAGALYLMSTTSGGSLRPAMQINSLGNAYIGIQGNNPLNGGGAANWLTIDATAANTYSGGLIFAIGGVSQGSLYSESGYLKVQSPSGVGIKLIVNSNDQLTILSSGQAAINTTPRTNVALTTAAGWSGPGGWYIAHSAEATSYPMIRWLATGVDKASAIGNNGDGSLYFSVGGSSGAIGLTPFVINATGDSIFSSPVLFNAANAPLKVGGSGYTLSPTYMQLGLYTSVRSYIQVPGGSTGQVEFWDASTNAVALVNAYGIGLYGSPGTSGNGITFPAVQQNSSNANTLDDYEEGSFSGSVTLRGSGTAGTYGISVGSATYTKIGRLVMIQMSLSITSASGGTGYLQITGLPFSNSAQCVGSVEGNYMTLNASTAQIVPEFISASGQTTIYFREMFTSGSGQDFPVSNISSSSGFVLTMTYPTST